jgi:hypothetical protein
VEKEGQILRESVFEAADQEVAGRGETMKIKSVALNLSPDEAFRLISILADEDKEGALLFLRQCLKPQLDQAGRGRLVRSFEAP